MHSITIKKDAFFFIATTEEISQDNFAVGQTFCYSSGHNLQFMEYVFNRYVLQGCRNEKDSGGELVVHRQKLLAKLVSWLRRLLF